MNKRVCVIYGTRPEAIKLAPVIALLKSSSNLNVSVICTGQHKEMLVGILELWGLRADIDLHETLESGHASLIPELMHQLEPELRRMCPDLLIVQGDTATAAAAAIQGHALRIPIAHVEAGLRSGDLWNPWPEESNRRIIDSISSLHFAPTEVSADHLRTEAHETTVTVTGNTVVDALNYVATKLENRPDIQLALQKLLGFSLAEEFILFTQHRREGFGRGQEQVFEAMLQLANLGHKVVFPVHMNPAVKNKANDFFVGHENIYLIPPQPYLYFLNLLRKCKLVISDSGGLQEEAPTFGKSIVITRITTERPEVIESGFGSLVGFNTEKIVNTALNEIKLNRTLTFANPFGDGNAATRICKAVEEFLGFQTRNYGP
jgi:UDP-N-acetylglucosamine 2-epimerase (non-hydrolysing)